MEPTPFPPTIYLAQQSHTLNTAILFQIQYCNILNTLINKITQNLNTALNTAVLRVVKQDQEMSPDSPLWYCDVWYIYVPGMKHRCGSSWVTQLWCDVRTKNASLQKKVSPSPLTLCLIPLKQKEEDLAVHKCRKLPPVILSLSFTSCHYLSPPWIAKKEYLVWLVVNSCKERVPGCNCAPCAAEMEHLVSCAQLWTVVAEERVAKENTSGYNLAQYAAEKSLHSFFLPFPHRPPSPHSLELQRENTWLQLCTVAAEKSLHSFFHSLFTDSRPPWFQWNWK